MILEQIVADKRRELETVLREVPEARLREEALKQPAPLDLASALQGDRLRIIAEVKKASPSRGIICRDFDPER